MVRGGTHIPKVVCSNSGIIHWMDIFFIPICCKICNVCLKKAEINSSLYKGKKLTKTFKILPKGRNIA